MQKDTKTDQIPRLVKEVVSIVLSSKRPMPAHFTDNKGRTQSFCIEFFINANHECQMASEAWQKAQKAANQTAK